MANWFWTKMVNLQVSSFFSSVANGRMESRAKQCESFKSTGGRFVIIFRLTDSSPCDNQSFFFLQKNCRILQFLFLKSSTKKMQNLRSSTIFLQKKKYGLGAENHRFPTKLVIHLVQIIPKIVARVRNRAENKRPTSYFFSSRLTARIYISFWQ